MEEDFSEADMAALPTYQQMAFNVISLPKITQFGAKVKCSS